MSSTKLFIFLSIFLQTAYCWATEHYTVNLMWINRKLNVHQQFLYPASTEQMLHKKFLRHIFKWAKASQGGEVHLWYDGEHTPKQALLATQRIIQNYLEKSPAIAPIILRNIRTLRYVQQHPRIFSDKTPIYFRVDLLRVIAQVQDIETGVTPYFVYGDLDMKPLTKKELFTQKTMLLLKRFGLVMAYCPLWFGFENGFQIVSNHNPNMLEAMKFALIELNIKRAYNALENKLYNAYHQSIKRTQLIKKYLTKKQFETSHKESYSLNIIWLNHRLNKHQQHIHPAQNSDEVAKMFFDPIILWATANPKATINIWFDSYVTTAQAVSCSKKRLYKAVQDLEHAKIIFKDVRSIPYVQKHAKIFSPNIYTYHQKMLLSTITALHEIRSGSVCYTIMAPFLQMVEYKDFFNLKTFSRNEIFNYETLKDLKNYGVSFIPKAHMLKAVLSNKNPEALELLEKRWLKPVIEKTYESLDDNHCLNNCCLNAKKVLEQIVFLSYPPMFKYFYHRTNLGTLYVNNEAYSQEKHGLSPLGINRLKHNFQFEPGANLPPIELGSVWIPTKNVELPRAELAYDDNDPIRNKRRKKKYTKNRKSAFEEKNFLSYL